VVSVIVFVEKSEFVDLFLCPSIMTNIFS